MLAIVMKMGLVLYNEMKADSSYEYATDMWLVDDFYNYQVLKEVRALSGFAGMECHGDLLLFMRRAARPSVCVRVYAMPASERHKDYHFIIYCCAERCNNKSVSECFSPPPHKMKA